MEHRDVLLAEGTRVDTFQICGFLGEGAMGQVYLAQDTLLGRRVALKFIKRSIVESQNIERFLEEARATASFNHPHIVTLHAAGDYDGQPYLALEYLDGESLRSQLRRGPLAMREALRYCSGVAEAIAEAHRRGLVHADLKPENIMIPRDGRVRVVDFGLAKPAGNAPGGASGTPAYMAPERWRGAPPTGAIDIWAFGVTLYEMVTGRRPFPDTVLPHLGFAKAMPMLIGLPEAPWLELVRDCLAFDPVARPTADELVPRIIGQLDLHAVTPHDARSGVARRTTTSTSHDASQLAAAWGTGPRLLHPATSMLLDAVTGARDATEFRQEAARWLERHVGAEAVLVAPIPHLARDAAAGLVGLDPAWLRRLVDGFGRYRTDLAQIAVLSRRWRGFTRARDTYLSDWPRRHGSAGFNEDLVFPYGLVFGTAAVLEVRRSQIGMVLVGRERSSRRFTDGECDLLNGILPILAMGEAIHASTATLAAVSAPSLAQPSHPGLTSRAPTRPAGA